MWAGRWRVPRGEGDDTGFGVADDRRIQQGGAVHVHRPGLQASNTTLCPPSAQQPHLHSGVVQHVSGHRVPFGVVAVQQPLRCPAADLGGQFPAEVERVLNAEVEPLPAGRRVDMRRVAGQQRCTPQGMGLVILTTTPWPYPPLSIRLS